MGITGSIIAFIIIWWAVLFAVLPMRVKGQWEDTTDIAKGTDPGAPIDPKLWFKFKRTTWVSACIWVVVFIVVSSGLISYGE